MAAFSERKQALHDRIAGTLVHRRPNSSSGALVIVFVLVFFVGIAVIGILAAIAIPAYQDYAHRARAAGALEAMTAQEQPVADYAAKNGQWPASWDQLGVPDPSAQLTPDQRSSVTAIHLGKDGAIVADLKMGKVTGELRLVPSKDGGAVTWACEADKAVTKFVPARCR
jgi:type IV pilus assembly protein PilA